MQLENIRKAYLQKHFKPSIVIYLKNVPVRKVGAGQRWEMEGAPISLWRGTYQAFEWPLGSPRSPHVYQGNWLESGVPVPPGTDVLIWDPCVFSLRLVTVKWPWGFSAPFSLVPDHPQVTPSVSNLCFISITALHFAGCLLRQMAESISSGSKSRIITSSIY